MAYAMHAIPLPKAPTTHLTRQYQYSQTDLLGSENCDTAIALMAAHAMMHADGDVWSKFDSSEDVLQTMSSGIVWHSRYAAHLGCVTSRTSAHFLPNSCTVVFVLTAPYARKHADG